MHFLKFYICLQRLYTTPWSTKGFQTHYFPYYLFQFRYLLSNYCKLFVIKLSYKIAISQKHQDDLIKVKYQLILSQADMLVLYCCITNQHKLSIVKQYPFISLQFCMSEVWTPGISAQSFTGRNQGDGHGGILSGGSEGNLLPGSFTLLVESSFLPMQD